MRRCLQFFLMVIILAVVIIIILKAAGVGALRNVPVPLPSFHVGALPLLVLAAYACRPFYDSAAAANHVSMAFCVKDKLSDCAAPWRLLPSGEALHASASLPHQGLQRWLLCLAVGPEAQFRLG